ncbi:E3 ubiquitin-protein ligase PRT1 [Populus alba x Populus x berolinensis]|nr:E3 ubiquitin-protein ligase PRT1 [Populus alba x Populus x berolinensis]
MAIHPSIRAVQHRATPNICPRLARVVDTKPKERGGGKVTDDAVMNFAVTGKDHHFLVDADLEEEFSISFRCSICLLRPHFLFLMLHFLLFKLYPTVYTRREEQTLEEEMEMGFFSPQFGYKECNSDLQHHHPRDRKHALDSCFFRNGEFCASTQQIESVKSVSMIQAPTMSIRNKVRDENCCMIKPDSVEENNLPEDKSNRNCKQVSIADGQCSTCKQLLYHPVVLNCGHVYCETCIGPVNEMLTCQVCQSLHPRGFPKVCLEFDHFLEEYFPTEYAMRIEAVQAKRSHNLVISWWADPSSKVHVGVGCDSCGVFPIVGDRYKCKDCVEEIGFDLCGDCYNTCSKRPGRFNQQHTSEHKFELVKPNIIHNIMLRLVTGQLDSASAFANHDDASGISENESPAPILSSDAQDSSRNSSASAATNPDSAEDENETQTTR